MRAAVLGHPITHSLSPTLHRAAYAALGLDDWSYEACDVTEDGLAPFLSALGDGSSQDEDSAPDDDSAQGDDWAGLSLTMPLKKAVIPLLDHIEPLADVVGAVNTVLIQPGRTLVGANTDVYGIVTALQEQLIPQRGDLGRAVILGAGATAASALAALAQLGWTSPVVLVRSMGRTGPLRRAAHRMGVTPTFASLDDVGPLRDAAVVVSTLPAHAADPIAEQLCERQARIADQSAQSAVQSDSEAAQARQITAVLLDVVYDPRPTALERAWAASGGTVVGGERMLLHQAAEQVRLMTGRTAPLAAMDRALRAALN